jgi:hypothetical protein
MSQLLRFTKEMYCFLRLRCVKFSKIDRFPLVLRYVSFEDMSNVLREGNFSLKCLVF